MKSPLAIMTALALLSTASLARAELVTRPGQLCQRPNPGVSGVGGVTPYTHSNHQSFGVYNPHSNAEVNVLCPLPAKTVNLVSPSSVRVIVYDRNPIQNVTCTVHLANELGGVLWTDTRSSSGSSPNATALVFNLPSGAAALVSFPGAKVVTLSCSIPRKYDALNAVSHVANYSFSYTPAP